ncbi:hypothetical protein, partial [Devosia indica]
HPPPKKKKEKKSSFFFLSRKKTQPNKRHEGCHIFPKHYPTVKFIAKFLPSPPFFFFPFFRSKLGKRLVKNILFQDVMRFTLSRRNEKKKKTARSDVAKEACIFLQSISLSLSFSFFKSYR